ncbi:orotidine-5'-phosphate decarboxylase [Sciscionella sediminilitoris]|uniref:orotidine-5'-phosphate decarboxylase n=1 Tax=Sciscionella sediminilitoris TaxID=1445613 RepID=UPI0004DF9161|nr:orotidine-5'-phosphate decarboxylase [Sciscionella sp. SE31]
MTGPAETFGERLASVTGERGRLCVGIDPHPGLLRDWGLEADARGLEKFARTCVEAFGSLAGVIKPQSAFFESYGSAGIAVLERVLTDARAAGAVTLLDVKRGDIGSTMSAYAQAYLADGAPLAADAITLSPYLGFGSLEPAIELARRTGRGVFVLARTSNPEGAGVQRAHTEGRSIAQAIVDHAAEINADGAGSVGVVIGATAAHGLDIGSLRGPILAPGFGAQGAGPEELSSVFGAAREHVLPASSRDILAKGPEVDRLRNAVRTVSALLSEHE